MASAAELKEIKDAWRALDGASETPAEGWKTIRVAMGGPCQIRAGRRFPGNEEAVLVGFKSMRLPKSEPLPIGHGFVVSEEDLGAEQGDHTWIALSRQPAGSRDLFGVMAGDLARMLQARAGGREPELFHAFLARIRAWQDFMQRGSARVLSPEREVGLFGELVVLRMLVEYGVSLYLAVESWIGPCGGLRDFTMGQGGMEVKSTVAVGSFPARIGSLDQLDDSMTRPLYLAGVRLALVSAGTTLSDAVSATRALLDVEPAARHEFDSRLLRGGYIDATADEYTRRFKHLSTRLLAIADGFPRLTRANVPSGVTRTQYEIDLDLVTATEVSFAEALRSLGGIA